MKALRLSTALFLGILLAMGLLASTSQAAPLKRPGTPVTHPAANTHTASQDATISITYDEPISPTTVSAQTFVVHAMQTGQLMQTYLVDGGTISLDPALPFKPGEQVQASATTGTLSLIDGLGPIAPTVWQFRVEASGGTGQFTDSGQRLGNANYYELDMGDLDGDGDLDVFAVNPESELGASGEVWRNNGSGYFALTQSIIENLYTSCVDLGDLDGDGDLDAFLAHIHNGGSTVWMNDGTGFFSDSGQSLGHGFSNGATLGDLDGDGDLDAYIENYFSGPDEVWLNDGSGFFSDSGQRLGNSSTTDAALGDLDGDGDLDAFVSNLFYDPKEVWLNDGAGNFELAQEMGGDTQSPEVDLGDLDGDGDLDAYTASTYDTPDTVWLNDGTGNFSDSGQLLGNWSSTGISLGDLDGDGDLDAFNATHYAQPDIVWLNNGSGVFSDSGQRLGNFNSSHTALGDIDSDGDLDAVVATYSGGPITVWFNTNQADCVPLTLQRGGTGNVADAFIVLNKPGTNHGKNESLYTWNYGETRKRTLIHFDVAGALPPGAVIQSASFSIYQFASLSPSMVTAHNITAVWQEATVTWNSFGNAFNPTPFASWQANANGWYSLDITALTQGWINGSTPNYGILLNHPASSSVEAYRSSDYNDVSYRPKLDLCYFP